MCIFPKRQIKFCVAIRTPSWISAKLEVYALVPIYIFNERHSVLHRPNENSFSL